MFKKIFGSATGHKLIQAINESKIEIENEFDIFRSEISSKRFSDFHVAHDFFKNNKMKGDRILLLDKFYGSYSSYRNCRTNQSNRLTQSNWACVDSIYKGSRTERDLEGCFVCAIVHFNGYISYEESSEYSLKEKEKIAVAFSMYINTLKDIHHYVDGHSMPVGWKAYKFFVSLYKPTNANSFSKQDMASVLGAERTDKILEKWGEGFQGVGDLESAALCYKMIDPYRAAYFKLTNDIPDFGYSYFGDHYSESPHLFSCTLRSLRGRPIFPVSELKNYLHNSEVKEALKEWVDACNERNTSTYFDALELLELYDRGFNEAVEKGLTSKALDFAKHVEANDAALKLLSAGVKSEEMKEIMNKVTNYDAIISQLIKVNDFSAAATFYEKRGEIDRAADMLVKAGSTSRAASLYKKNDTPEKALELFLKADMPTEAIEMAIELEDFALAAKICADNRKFSDAAHYYQKAGSDEQTIAMLIAGNEHQKASEMLVKHGNSDKAASVLMDGRKFEQAAILFKELKKYQDAAQAYVQASMHSEAAECFSLAGQVGRSARCRVDAGDYIGAAAQYLEAGETGAAVEAYLLANDYQKAAAVWLDHGETDKAVQLYIDQDEISEAARLCVQLERPQQAAELFVRAGDISSAIAEFIKAEQYVEAYGRAIEIGEYQQALDLVPLLEDKKPFLERIHDVPLGLLTEKAVEKGFADLIAVALLKNADLDELSIIDSFKQFYEVLIQNADASNQIGPVHYVYSRLAKDVPVQLGILEREKQRIVELGEPGLFMDALRINGYQMQLANDQARYAELHATLLNHCLTQDGSGSYDPETLKYYLANCLMNEDHDGFQQAKVIIYESFPALVPFSEKVGTALGSMTDPAADWSGILSSFDSGPLTGRSSAEIDYSAGNIVDSGLLSGSEFSPERLASHVANLKKDIVDANLEIFKGILADVVSLSQTSTHEAVEPELIPQFFRMYNEFSGHFRELLSRQEQTSLLATICDIVKFSDPDLHMQLFDLLENEYGLDLSE